MVQQAIKSTRVIKSYILNPISGKEQAKAQYKQAEGKAKPLFQANSQAKESSPRKSKPTPKQLLNEGLVG